MVLARLFASCGCCSGLKYESLYLAYVQGINNIYIYIHTYTAGQGMQGARDVVPSGFSGGLQAVERLLVVDAAEEATASG